MRTLYIAGFFAPTLEQLRVKAKSFVDERSVVLVPQRNDRQIDLNHLKSDLFDQLQRSCETIRICAFVFRNQEYVWHSLEGIVDNARTRFPNANVELKRFQNAQDVDRLIEEIARFSPTRIFTFPDSLDTMEEWFAARFGGRIFFHPRALRGAKNSQFDDVSAIYAALVLLAKEYWDMRVASGTAAPNATGAFINRLQQLRLELSPSISPTRAGEQGDEYFVTYPVGTSSKKLLDLHLRLGDDRDERRCLRIYFFWDDLGPHVVVGWLPNHLSTRSS